MTRLPPIAALRAFEAAARHHSFTKAAAELNVTQSAISHQVRHLEDLWGLKMFDRRPRHLALTRRYLQQRQAVFRMKNHAVRYLAGLRGGVVENIYIRDILMKDIHTDAIRFNTFYRGVSPKESFGRADYKKQTPAPVTEETPLFRNIYMENIVCSGAGRAAFIQGLPEQAVRGIEIKNLRVSADQGMTVVNTDGLKFIDSSLDTPQGETVYIVNSRDIAFVANHPPAGALRVWLAGPKTGAVLFKGYDPREITESLRLDNDVPNRPRIER